MAVLDVFFSTQLNFHFHASSNHRSKGGTVITIFRTSLLSAIAIWPTIYESASHKTHFLTMISYAILVSKQRNHTHDAFPTVPSGAIYPATVPTAALPAKDNLIRKPHILVQ